MNYIQIEGNWVSVFAVCQAHAQLESDYNKNGILQERPSNQRRNSSTGVQLHRMKYVNLFSWTNITEANKELDDADDENVRWIYLSNVLKWNLPFEQDIAEVVAKTFTATALAPYQHRIDTAIATGRYWPSKV